MPLIKLNSNKSFLILLIVTALLIAGSAAYFSIFGISKVFVGASTAVIIMASALEIGKLVGVSFLYQYWEKTSGLLKTYMTIAIISLMIITSAGIYGFLSSAHQETSNTLEQIDNKINTIQTKKQFLLDQKQSYDNQIQLKNNRIATLTELRNNQESRLNDLYSKNYISAAKRTEQIINKSDGDIITLNSDINDITQKINVINDSIYVLDNKILTEQNNEVLGDIGPLKYVAQLTNLPINKIINYFILLIIFVFDPLAISLILAANRILYLNNNKEENFEIKREKPKQKKILYNDLKTRYFKNFFYKNDK